MPRQTTLLAATILLTLPVAPSAAFDPGCAVETLPQARIACLGGAAEAAFADLDLRVARISAAFGTLGLDPGASFGTAPDATSVAAAQATWRDEVEAACDSLDAPDPLFADEARQACRLRLALERIVLLDQAFPAGAAADPLAGLQPYVFVRPRRGGGFGRPEIMIEPRIPR